MSSSSAHRSLKAASISSRGRGAERFSKASKLRPAGEAVSEAIRAMSQMSQLPLGVFNAYPLAVEAAIKGTIAVQNAMFAAGMAFLDASTNSSRTVAQQWTEAARQAEQAKLEVWQAGVSAGDGLLARGSSGEMAGQEDKGQKR